YRLRLEIPCFSKDEVNLTAVDDQLTVKAESESQEATYERTLTLPDTIERDGISAKLENGILELTFPKAEVVEPTTRNIEIS
ncbi:Hsp20/alpha crystallin family protein, partial [bacterium]|nr:Hsp20/alpha crystallin family protein [bacterium]